MKTISFIGSDKNAGKTTVLKFTYGRMVPAQGTGPLCLTSIGINGEGTDNYEGEVKPKITVRAGTYFVTHPDRLHMLSGLYEVCCVLVPPRYRKTYVLALMRMDSPVVLEGPNEKSEVLCLKEDLDHFFSNQGTLLIDGSIDRQFLAHPEISDEISFSLLVSNREEQREKAKVYLESLNIPLASVQVKEQIKSEISESCKSLLFDNQGQCLYRGVEVPFLDATLKKNLMEQKKHKCLLYLNGVLSKSLYAFLSSFAQLHIVLNNFTLFQVIRSKENGFCGIFKPELSLYHQANVRRIYLKEETTRMPFVLPAGVELLNLYQGVGL